MRHNLATILTLTVFVLLSNFFTVDLASAQTMTTNPAVQPLRVVCTITWATEGSVEIGNYQKDDVDRCVPKIDEEINKGNLTLGLISFKSQAPYVRNNETADEIRQNNLLSNRRHFAQRELESRGFSYQLFVHNGQMASDARLSSAACRELTEYKTECGFRGVQVVVIEGKNSSEVTSEEFSLMVDQFIDLQQRVGALETWKLQVDIRLGRHDSRLDDAEERGDNHERRIRDLESVGFNLFSFIDAISIVGGRTFNDATAPRDAPKPADQVCFPNCSQLEEKPELSGTTFLLGIGFTKHFTLYKNLKFSATVGPTILQVDTEDEDEGKMYLGGGFGSFGPTYDFGKISVGFDVIGVYVISDGPNYAVGPRIGIDL